MKQGLSNGLLYTFRVFAINFNGVSEPSQTSTFYACAAPTGFSRPEIVSQNSALITIKWDPPVDDGGCRILFQILFTRRLFRT